MCAGQLRGLLQLQPLVRRQELSDQPEAVADRGRSERVSDDDHRVRSLLLLLQRQEEETNTR